MTHRHTSLEFHFISPERTRLALRMSRSIIIDTAIVIPDPLIDIQRLPLRELLPQLMLSRAALASRRSLQLL